jgi:hypothetical protein
LAEWLVQRARPARSAPPLQYESVAWSREPVRRRGSPAELAVLGAQHAARLELLLPREQARAQARAA